MSKRLLVFTAALLCLGARSADSQADETIGSLTEVSTGTLLSPTNAFTSGIVGGANTAAYGSSQNISVPYVTLGVRPVFALGEAGVSFSESVSYMGTKNETPTWAMDPAQVGFYGVRFHSTDSTLGAPPIRFEGIQDTEADLGALSDSSPRTISFSMKATSSSKGFIFANLVNWVNNTNTSVQIPLLDQIAAALDEANIITSDINSNTFSNNNFFDEEFGYSVNVALYVDGSRSSATLISVLGPTAVSVASWNKAQLFDGQWHLVVITIEPQGSDSIAQMFIDGATDFSSREWRQCSTSSYYEPYSEPAKYGVVVSTTTNATSANEKVATGGQLVVGYMVLTSLFNLQLHGVALEQTKMIGTLGVESMFSEVKIGKIAAIVIGSFMILVGLVVFYDLIVQIVEEIRGGEVGVAALVPVEKKEAEAESAPVAPADTKAPHKQNEVVEVATTEEKNGEPSPQKKKAWGEEESTVTTPTGEDEGKEAKLEEPQTREKTKETADQQQQKAKKRGGAAAGAGAAGAAKAANAVAATGGGDSAATAVSSGTIVMEKLIAIVPTFTDVFQGLSLYFQGWTWPYTFTVSISWLTVPLSLNFNLPDLSIPPFVTIIILLLFGAVGIVVVLRFANRDEVLFRDSLDRYRWAAERYEDLVFAYLSKFMKMNKIYDAPEEEALRRISKAIVRARKLVWSYDDMKQLFPQLDTEQYDDQLVELALKMPPPPKNAIEAMVSQFAIQSNVPIKNPGGLARALANAEPGKQITDVARVYANVALTKPQGAGLIRFLCNHCLLGADSYFKKEEKRHILKPALLQFLKQLAGKDSAPTPDPDHVPQPKFHISLTPTFMLTPDTFDVKEFEKRKKRQRGELVEEEDEAAEEEDTMYKYEAFNYDDAVDAGAIDGEDLKAFLEIDKKQQKQGKKFDSSGKESIEYHDEEYLFRKLEKRRDTVVPSDKEGYFTVLHDTTETRRQRQGLRDLFNHTVFHSSSGEGRIGDPIGWPAEVITLRLTSSLEKEKESEGKTKSNPSNDRRPSAHRYDEKRHSHPAPLFKSAEDGVLDPASCPDDLRFLRDVRLVKAHKCTKHTDEYLKEQGESSDILRKVWYPGHTVEDGFGDFWMSASEDQLQQGLCEDIKRVRYCTAKDYERGECAENSEGITDYLVCGRLLDPSNEAKFQERLRQNRIEIAQNSKRFRQKMNLLRQLKAKLLEIRKREVQAEEEAEKKEEKDDGEDEDEEDEENNDDGDSDEDDNPYDCAESDSDASVHVTDIADDDIQEKVYEIENFLANPIRGTDVGEFGIPVAFKVTMASENLMKCPRHDAHLIPAQENSHYQARNIDGSIPYVCALTRSHFFKEEHGLHACTPQDLYVCSDDTCGYTLCKSCAELYGKRGKFGAIAAGKVYDARKDPAGMVSLIAFLALQFVYIPAVQNALFVLACHPTYHCLFPVCYERADVNYIVAASVSGLLALILGLGLPIFWLQALYRRRNLIKECVGSAAQWNWFLDLDHSVLSNLYRKYEQDFMLFEPILLLTGKASIVLIVAFTEANGLTQLISLSVVQSLNALLLVFSDPLIDPWADVMMKSGQTHQLFQLGWTGIHRGLLFDDPSSQVMGYPMIATLGVFVIGFIIILVVAVIQPFLKARKFATGQTIIRQEVAACAMAGQSRQQTIERLLVEKGKTFKPVSVGGEDHKIAHFQVLLSKALLVSFSYGKWKLDSSETPKMELASEVLNDFAVLIDQSYDPSNLFDFYSFSIAACPEAQIFALTLILTGKLMKEVYGYDEEDQLRENMRKQLVRILERRIPEESVGAANAMTLLIKLGHKFDGADLSGVFIPGASLQGANFSKVNFTEVDFTDVDATMATFYKCDFTNACIANTKFTFKESSQALALLTFKQNPDVVAHGSREAAHAAVHAIDPDDRKITVPSSPTSGDNGGERTTGKEEADSGSDNSSDDETSVASDDDDDDDYELPAWEELAEADDGELKETDPDEWENEDDETPFDLARNREGTRLVSPNHFRVDVFNLKTGVHLKSFRVMEGNEGKQLTEQQNTAQIVKEKLAEKKKQKEQDEKSEQASRSADEEDEEEEDHDGSSGSGDDSEEERARRTSGEENFAYHEGFKSADISPDGSLIAISTECFLAVFDAHTCREMWRIWYSEGRNPFEYQELTGSEKFNQAGNLIFHSCIGIVDTRAGRIVIPLARIEAILGLAVDCFVPHDPWSLSRPKENPHVKEQPKYKPRIVSASWSPSGRKLLVGLLTVGAVVEFSFSGDLNPDNEYISIEQLNTGYRLGQYVLEHDSTHWILPFNEKQEIKAQNLMHVLEYSPSGKMFGVLIEDINEVFLVFPSAEVKVQKLYGHQDSPSSLVFSPDGTKLVTTGVGYAYIWNVAQQKVIGIIKNPSANAALGTALWTYDSARVLIVDEEIKAWDGSGGRPDTTIVLTKTRTALPSHDPKTKDQIVTCGDGTNLWNVFSMLHSVRYKDKMKDPTCFRWFLPYYDHNAPRYGPVPSICALDLKTGKVNRTWTAPGGEDESAGEAVTETAVTLEIAPSPVYDEAGQIGSYIVARVPNLEQTRKRRYRESLIFCIYDHHIPVSTYSPNYRCEIAFGRRGGKLMLGIEGPKIPVIQTEPQDATRRMHWVSWLSNPELASKSWQEIDKDLNDEDGAKIKQTERDQMLLITTRSIVWKVNFVKGPEYNAQCGAVACLLAIPEPYLGFPEGRLHSDEEYSLPRADYLDPEEELESSPNTTAKMIRSQLESYGQLRTVDMVTSEAGDVVGMTMEYCFSEGNSFGRTTQFIIKRASHAPCFKVPGSAKPESVPILRAEDPTLSADHVLPADEEDFLEYWRKRGHESLAPASEASLSDEDPEEAECIYTGWLDDYDNGDGEEPKKILGRDLVEKYKKKRLKKRAREERKRQDEADAGMYDDSDDDEDDDWYGYDDDEDDTPEEDAEEKEEKKSDHGGTNPSSDRSEPETGSCTSRESQPDSPSASVPSDDGAFSCTSESKNEPEGEDGDSGNEEGQGEDDDETASGSDKPADDDGGDGDETASRASSEAVNEQEEVGSSSDHQEGNSSNDGTPEENSEGGSEQENLDDEDDSDSELQMRRFPRYQFTDSYGSTKMFTRQAHGHVLIRDPLTKLRKRPTQHIEFAKLMKKEQFINKKLSELSSVLNSIKSSPTTETSSELPPPGRIDGMSGEQEDQNRRSSSSTSGYQEEEGPIFTEDRETPCYKFRGYQVPRGEPLMNYELSRKFFDSHLMHPCISADGKYAAIWRKEDGNDCTLLFFDLTLSSLRERSRPIEIPLPGWKVRSIEFGNFGRLLLTRHTEIIAFKISKILYFRSLLNAEDASDLRDAVNDKDDDDDSYKVRFSVNARNYIDRELTVQGDAKKYWNPAKQIWDDYDFYLKRKKQQKEFRLKMNEADSDSDVEEPEHYNTSPHYNLSHGMQPEDIPAFAERVTTKGPQFLSNCKAGSVREVRAIAEI